MNEYYVQRKAKNEKMMWGHWLELNKPKNGVMIIKMRLLNSLLFNFFPPKRHE